MKQPPVIALFGESEKGDFQEGHLCQNLNELINFYGNPPPESQGLHYAIQALMYEHPLLFFRVQEEGYSQQDYFLGLHFIISHQLSQKISAICAPGTSDAEIMNAIAPFCKSNKMVLIMSEPDFYDYLIG